MSGDRYRSRTIRQSETVNGYLNAYQKPSPTGDWEEWNASRESVGLTPSEVKETWDRSSRGFNRRRAAGEIICSPFISRTTTVIHPPLTTFHHHTTKDLPDGTVGAKWDGSYVAWSYGGAPEPLGLPPEAMTMKQDVIDKAVTAAHANINESDLLALATIAESEKTVEFLVQSARRLIRLGRRARRVGDLLQELNRGYQAVPRRVVRAEARALADRYMELRYAARPIVYDMVGVMKAATKPRFINRKTFRGQADDSCDYQDTQTGRLFFYETVADVDRVSRYTVSARAGVLTTVSLSSLQPYGLGIEALPSTVWELIPFSFIMDWVANVGQTIGSQIPKAGVTQLASWVSVIGTWDSKVATENIRSIASDSLWDSHSSAGSCQSYGRREVAHERIVSPALRTWPQVDMNLNMYKLIDLAIIARRVFR